MRAPRGLSTGEQAAWAHLAASVKPLPGKQRPEPSVAVVLKATSQPASTPPPPSSEGVGVSGGRRKLAGHIPTMPVATPDSGLDSHWDRRAKGGRLEPDLTLDLHGHTLDTAYDRIIAGLDQARMMGARVVLVIAGRERPVDPADRMAKRGAIRAQLLDWLAASRHGSAITAVRRAHIRHGGEGALYLILKRRG